MKKTVPLLVVFLFLITSCNSFFQVEKRHYRKGFYIHHSNSDNNTFSVDSVSTPSSKNQVIKKTSLLANHKNNSPVRKVETAIAQKSPGTFRKKMIQFINKQKVCKLLKNIPNLFQSKEQDDGTDRNTLISKYFGIAAIVLIVLGLLLIETSLFGLNPIIIGFFCGLFGLQFGRRALTYSPQKRRGKSPDELNERRKKAKTAYLLNLCALLFLFAYILFRIGLILITSSFGLAIILLILCLILFITFKLGWYRDLGNQDSQK